MFIHGTVIAASEGSARKKKLEDAGAGLNAAASDRAFEAHIR